MLLKQTHEAKKNPIKVKGPRVPNKNPLADTPEQIRIRPNNFLISTKSLLPMEEEWCLYHPKHILRQEAQNNFYDTL